jgi:hypothetical protein
MAPRRQLTPVEMEDLSRQYFELVHDPQTRPYIAKLVKHKFPDRAVHFKDVEHAEEIKKLRGEIEQEKHLAAGRQAQEKMQAQRTKLFERYNEDQVKDIEKVMQRYGGVDYDAAAVLYAHENPSVNPEAGPPPEERSGATFEFPTVSGKDGKPLSFEDFAKNPTAAAQNAAYQVITEFKRRNVGSNARR